MGAIQLIDLGLKLCVHSDEFIRDMQLIRLVTARQQSHMILLNKV